MLLEILGFVNKFLFEICFEIRSSESGNSSQLLGGGQRGEARWYLLAYVYTYTTHLTMAAINNSVSVPEARIFQIYDPHNKEYIHFDRQQHPSRTRFRQRNKRL